MYIRGSIHVARQVVFEKTLDLPQLSIQSILRQQFFVRSHLGNSAVIQHDNFVRMHQC